MIIYDWIILIALAVFAAGLVNRFIFYLTVVDSWSMYPTLKPGDRLFTVRPFRLDGIRRGDILVFNADEHTGRMIKRVLGLPGDEVELRGGIVYINQIKQDEPYVQCPSQCTCSFEVPERHYLFLGDNRTDSVDSRSWTHPYIPEKNIRGKVILRLKLSRIDSGDRFKSPAVVGNKKGEYKWL